jgi:hypothetical protein
MAKCDLAGVMRLSGLCRWVLNVITNVLTSRSRKWWRITVLGQPRQKSSETLSQKQARIVLHACGPSYSGGKDRRIKDEGWPLAKCTRPYLIITKSKKAGGMAQMIELLPHKCQAISSNPRYPLPQKKGVVSMNDGLLLIHLISTKIGTPPSTISVLPS